MTELHVQVLGGFRLHDAAGREIRIASRKGRAMLAYLALRPGETHSRERLAALLWEDSDEELARTSLRQALAAVRRALPESAQRVLLADAGSVSIDPDLVASDLVEFKRGLSEGASTSLKDAVALYRGDLLDGFDARSTAFEEWLTQERISLRKQMSEALHKLTQLCAANDDGDGALRACSRLVAMEPLNEAAHRRLMELHAQRQAYAEALRQYRVCRDALRRELDVAPEPATEQLYRDLMRRRRAALPGAEMEADDFAAEAPASSVASEPLRAEMRSELREAVILIARLEGLLEGEAQLDPEEALALSMEFEGRVRAAAEEFGGRADRRVGSNVMAVFGAPNAYGNEPERAVRAAMMLRDQTEHTVWPAARGSESRPSRPLELRIGIAQGQVLCSPGVFPLTGRPTHIAHTLASHASDREILISDELRQSLSDRVVAQLAPVDRRDQGVAPIMAWRLQSLRSDGAASQPLVGRRPELAMILAALDRCATRHGRAILVRGEAGIGKTRLVDAVRVAARERRVAVHAAQVFDFGQSPGRGPITTLALSLLGLSADAAPGERLAAVRRLAAARGGGVDELVFLSDLVDAPLDGELEALEKAMNAATRQRGRTRALTLIIEAAARESAQLLVVEDVHWADGEELARFGDIAATIANCPVLFILTTRPEGDPISAAWRARARGCPVTTVDLAPLADDEARELAAQYPELAAETIEACIRRADGYPLFLDQLLRAASAGHDVLPGSVRTLVLARLDKLSARDHLALQAAAVLGQRAQLATVRRMIGDEAYDPAAPLAAALVRCNADEIEFAHALFRDAIYESTLKSKRRELHRAAARCFEGLDGPLYADHLAAAEDARAAAAYVDAADVERSLLRFERAHALAAKAAGLAREPAMLYRTSMLLGELLLQLGRTHEALASYREALEFASEQPDLGHAWFGVAGALRIMDRHDEALEALDRAEAALASSVDAQLRARLLTLRGNLCFPLGRLDACLRAHEEAYRYALQAQSPLEIARAQGGLGDAYYQRGQMLTARNHFAQCIREARDHGLIAVLLANLPMLGLMQTYSGELDAGRACCVESLELAKRIGDIRAELLSHLCMSKGLLVQMQAEECARRIGEALRLAEQIGSRRFQSECLGIIAETHLMLGDREQALALAEEALQLGRETGMSYCGPVLLSVLARVTPDVELRRARLDEGEELLAQGCVSHSHCEFYHHAIEVSVADRAWSEVRRYADRLAAYTATEPLPLTDLFIARARLLADLGEGARPEDLQARLAALRADCRRMNALAALTAIDEALAANPVH